MLTLGWSYVAAVAFYVFFPCLLSPYPLLLPCLDPTGPGSPGRGSKSQAHTLPPDTAGFRSPPRVVST